jgi:protease secretion system outer membrane protein
VTSDQRKLLQSEIIFLQEQLKSIKLGRQAGESTITEELEIQANLSITQAQLYAAESQIKDLNTRLARMLGMDPQKDIRLPAIRLPLKGLTILAIEHDNYIKMAVETNLEIASQKLMTEIALQEFKKNNSGHMPRVDIVANALRQDSYSSNTIDQRINQNYLGFQLSIPIFSGFEIQGRSAQAYSNYLKERELERAAENKVLNELQEELSRLANLQKQVQALQMATEAASKAVVATEKGIASGYRTRIDLLNMLKATQKAKKELLNAHYSYLVSYLKIKLISNQFKVDDLKLIDQQFTYANHQ